MPFGMTDQTRKVEDLLTGSERHRDQRIDPDNQGDTINKAAAQTNLITHDSDCTGYESADVYIGMDNYPRRRHVRRIPA